MINRQTLKRDLWVADHKTCQFEQWALRS